MRVLVADASATVRDGAQGALQGAGHQVAVAADGLEAWLVSRQQGFDAAFVAWDLPGLDALDLASLWQHDAAICGKPLVVLVQSSDVPQARAWAQLTEGQAPAWDVLRKPFAPRLITDVLEALVA